jgi:hypothetical protein
MSDDKAIINIGELSKPATVLIEKISDAIGGIFLPHQIRRVAQAEAEAERIRAVAQIEISQLQRRAVHRFLAEEAKKQNNIEAITQKALPALAEGAMPQDVEDDWITNFFDKCRLISNEEMQKLWSKVLAGEANSPGQYSKRTVNLLSSLDKYDAELFRTLCSFGWEIVGVVPLVYDALAPIYNQSGIGFMSLKHLDEIGLLSFESLSGYRRMDLPKSVLLAYYGRFMKIEFPAEKNDLDLGKVILSKAGQELARVCGSTPHPAFKDYVIERWRSLGYKVTEIGTAQHTTA